MDIFLDEHKEFLLLLLKHEVEFMLIGGYAVIFYGYERTTGDMDIWLKPSNENKVKFIEVLKSFGINEEHLKAAGEMNFEEAQMMHIGERPNRIDFLTKVYGLTYNEADEKKVLLPLKDQFVPVIDYHHLVIVKMFAGRPQDKADIDILQKIRNNKKE
jgi:hypothetical protein